MARAKQYWLMKSEADCFSIHDLAKSPKQTTYWDGVRNYQARNFMRDQMKIGDEVLFYHSNAEPSAVAGTAVIVAEAYPDHTQFIKTEQHYDPKSKPDNPAWLMVDIKLQSIFPEPIGLDVLRTVPALKDMELLRRGSRLSVMPVTKAEFDTIVKMATTKKR
jgi:predicted RNA-binding protein with PUA-like domain